MDSQKLACIFAAVSMALLGAATSASASQRDVFVTGKKSDTELQRLVSYADLDLARTIDRQVLGRRIAHTAWNICSDLDAADRLGACANEAIASTDEQLAAAIARAGRQIAGLPAGPAVAIAITANAG